MIVIQAKDYDEMSLKAYEAMKIVLTEKPEAVLGLATGSTPIGLYKCMIADYKAGAVSYKNMTSINLDEYASDRRPDTGHRRQRTHRIQRTRHPVRFPHPRRNSERRHPPRQRAVLR